MTAAERQRHDALRIANRVRFAGIRYRRELAQLPRDEAHERVVRLLLDPVDGPLGTLRVGHLLLSVPTLGPRKVTLLLFRAEIYSQDKRLAALTSRQRVALAHALRERMA